MDESAFLRIGELSRRTGVPPELLRAWERRYDLLRPQRTEGGFRLYSLDDVRRVQRMREHLAQGVGAAQAAALAMEERPAGSGGTAESGAAPGGRESAVQSPALGPPAGAGAPAAVEGGAVSGGPLGAGGAALRAALDAFDDGGAQAAFDDLFARYSIGAVLRDVVMPYLRDLGERWASGEATVAQEHFASTLLRGRLLGVARGWDRGAGPRALLACAPGELHDLSLIVFGLALHARGWRVTYLGQDVPLHSVAATADAIAPDVVVLVAITSRALDGEQAALAALGERHALALAGAAAREELARAVGARLLDGDPVGEAERLG